MKARKYTKKVEIWGATEVPDEYGGFTVENALLSKRWTFIQTKNSVRNTDDGQIENFQTIIFCFRGRNLELDNAINYIIYKGLKYVIDTIENVNLIDIDLKVYCTQYNGTA